MKRKIDWSVILLLIAFGAVLVSSSCSSIKNVKYFTDIPDTAKEHMLANVVYVDPLIQPDDILSIYVQTVDPTATQVITLGNIQSSAVGSTTAGGTGSQTVNGYLVDKSGYIEMPVLGKLKVQGLTTEQARNLIRDKASRFYKDPSVNVRFANFRITVLGEVVKPATYVVANEKITILDALGLAGDLTIYGRRDNLLLIRTYDDGRRETVRLDLTKSDVLNSPYYYLRQNDYIYVEPLKAKVVSSDAIQNRNISIVTAIGASLISVLAILLSTNKL
ncbi:polysaccharide biosynthesis/export family protein [Mucilaginibacter sp.]